jgi:hypothetical protein
MRRSFATGCKDPVASLYRRSAFWAILAGLASFRISKLLENRATRGFDPRRLPKSSSGRNRAERQLSFPNFLYEMSDNPSEKNDRHGDTQCGEFYACQESMEIEGVAFFALARAAGCERK